MSDCLYGKLNSETIKKEYQGNIEKIDPLKIDTVGVLVDNVNNTIRAQINKTPGTLKITKSVNAGEQRTLVEFDGSESKEINLDEVDTYTGTSTNETADVSVNSTKNIIDVQVLKTPGKIKFKKGGKILTDHLNREVEFDGSEDTTLHIPETTFKTTETFETIYDETTNTVSGNVLKVPYTLTIVDENAGTQHMFDGGKDYGDVTVNIPKFEGGVKQLVGTAETPVNLYNLKSGQLYAVQNFVGSTSDYYTITSGTLLVYKQSSNICIFEHCRLVSSSRIINITNSTLSQSYLVTVKSNGQLTIEVASTGVNRLNGSTDYLGPVSFFAPINGGASGQILQSNGNNSAPTWTTPNFATLDDVNNAINGMWEESY